eukprot:TRINITY_DN625_c0_g1_i3.p1 TRINITY_DN625_c0_g1~~TRINITY_DN625_c0_g1_i3.p1  ORF type:complete len:432 (+),score=65.32 TRINITY_DN625_c0_g1_i3:90-1385(+)
MPAAMSSTPRALLFWLLASTLAAKTEAQTASPPTSAPSPPPTPTPTTIAALSADVAVGARTLPVTDITGCAVGRTISLGTSNLDVDLPIYECKPGTGVAGDVNIDVSIREAQTSGTLIVFGDVTTQPTPVPTPLPPGAPTPAPTTVTVCIEPIPAGVTNIGVIDLTGCFVGGFITIAGEQLVIIACIPYSVNNGRRLQTLSGPGTVQTETPTTVTSPAGTVVTFEESTPTPGPAPACFAAESTVQLLSDSHPVPLAELGPGQSLLRASLDERSGDFLLADKVLGFLHDLNSPSDILTIEHEMGELRVSSNHKLHVETAAGRLALDKQAQDVVTGEALLLGASSSSSLVLTIRHDATMRGVRSPVTLSGYVTVDNVLASSYAAVAGQDVPHSSLHAAFFPLRALSELIAPAGFHLDSLAAMFLGNGGFASVV